MNWAAALLFVTAVSIPAWADYRYSDAHTHVLDYFQEGDPLSRLIEVMDENGVDHAMISGIPVMKQWHEDEPKRPRYFAGDDAGLYWYSATDSYVAEALKKLPQEQRKRLHPFLCGFNPNDKNADRHIIQMLEMYPGVWQGIGEIFTRHDELTALINDDTPRVNNEAMQRVYKVAAAHDLPVLVHSNITSRRESNPLYVEELESALTSHPKVRFIWAHAGTSKTLDRDQGEMEFLLPELGRLLPRYPNLTIDLSWTVLRPYLLDKEGQPDADWVQLVVDYPRQFVIGSDVLGSYDKLGENLREFTPFLDALPKPVAVGVARDNFLALLPAQGVTAKD